LTYDKRQAQRGLRGLIEVGRTLRGRGYDLVLSPHRSLRSACIVALSGSARRLGFDHWLTRWAYTKTVPRPQAGHEVGRNLHLLTALGAAAPALPGRLQLQVREASHRLARHDFATLGVSDSSVVVGIIPGSQWATKRWPAEHFAALIERLAATPNTYCVLFGASQERPIAEAILARCGAPVIDLVGQTTLRDLPAYMARCTVVVSNDTGPMHIAAALGKPIVALYGPTIPALGFAPYGVRWEEASILLPCRPCHAHGPQRCPLSHWRCMRDLSVAQVAAGVQRLLADANGAGEVDG
jgi:heptosyltransferase-2